MSDGKRARRIFLPLLLFFALSSIQPAMAQTVPADSAAVGAAAGRPVVARRPVVALALEGGGALGLAHIGVIKVIEELGIPIDIVVGTSMGAIVGGAYAMGYDAAAMEAVVASADWADLFSESSFSRIESYRDRLDRARYFASVGFDWKGLKLGGGLLSGRKVVSFLDRMAVIAPNPADFDSLPRRFRAVAADIETGERVVFDRGSIADAMRASMSIPGVFAPYFLDGRYFVDGGVVDNLPIEVARSLGADIVIAVDLRGGKPFTTEALERNPLGGLIRTVDILTDAAVNRQLPLADYVLPVDLTGYYSVDFSRSAEILAAGEASARANHAVLVDLVDRIRGDGPAASASVRPPAYPPIDTILVEGVEGRMRERVAGLFSPFIGGIADTDALARPVAELHEWGLFKDVRIRREVVGDGSTLIVSLEGRPPRGHEVRLGFSYGGTYTRTMTNRLTVNPSVIFRGLLTPDSRVTVDTSFIDSLGVEISVLQPIYRYFFAEAAFAYERDFETYLMGSSVEYRYQTIATSSGVRLGVMPFPGAEMSVGWRYDWIDEAELTVDEGAPLGGASLIETRFSVRDLDSPIFPMSGFALDLGYLYSDPAIGSEEAFRVLRTSGSAFLSLHTPFSVAVSWRGGTDFSDGLRDLEAAPAYYAPSLVDRRLFPGPLSMDERIGSHALGLGLELKYRLFRLSGLFGVPAFLLAHGASGVALAEGMQFDDWVDLFHWNATLGVGVRLSDAFGISFRGGVERDSEGDYTPFFALDVGSIGY